MTFARTCSALIAIAAIVGSVCAVKAQPVNPAAIEPTATTDPTALPVSRAIAPVVVIPELEAPWSMAFLPGGG